MKKFLKVFVPVFLALAIIAGLGWYLLAYDRDFTRDMLLQGARYFEKEGKLDTASWFYDRAYEQGHGSDEIAVELAQQYIESGNYTKAEVTLNRAIKDGGGVQVYTALCKAYVEQDKLLDAVELLDKISDPELKTSLDALRPAAPITPQTPGFYNQYISVSVECPDAQLYVSTGGEYPSINKDSYSEPIPLSDGENVLYALAVSDAGLVSPLSIFGYTVGGVVEEVVFEDSAIEQTVRYMLAATDDQVIYSNDLWDITEFTVPEDAQNYNDLRHMIFLDSLTITQGTPGQLQCLSGMSALKNLQITDTAVSQEELALIGSLITLEKLTLNGCSLSTTEGLQELTALTYLDLGNNAIRNISALSSMTGLKELYMVRNALQDLTALSSCPLLSVLDISYNDVTNLNSLSGLSTLSKLDISHNNLKKIAPLAQLTALTELRANNNSIADVSMLSACTALSYVDLSYNALTSIDTLAALDSVTYLNFSHNQVEILPVWSSSSALVTIDGSYNLIADLSGLKGLKSINNILMDYNENIESISELADCPLLIKVNVYGTKVTDVKALTDQSIIVNYNPLPQE